MARHTESLLRMRTWVSHVLSERARLFLLSLAIALTMWYYVTTTVQPVARRAPTASLRLHNVEVVIAGLPFGWRASANPAAVDVEVRWPAGAMLSVRPTDVRAVADVTSLEPGPHLVTLHIQVPIGAVRETTVQASPPSVTITLVKQ